MLIEKPFAVSKEEVNRLNTVVNEYRNKVMICHVLRYTPPFYSSIKAHIDNGDIGKVKNIQMNEHVNYMHFSSAFARGRWRNSDLCGTTMLLAKCCHDLDLLVWMNESASPSTIYSSGTNMQFKPANAPDGSGTRCVKDCLIEDSCVYSAKKFHLDFPERWGGVYAWEEFEGRDDVTLEEKKQLLLKNTTTLVCAYGNLIQMLWITKPLL